MARNRYTTEQIISLLREVIAALLHYAMGDQEVPDDLIVETFGEDVAGLVKEVTDDKLLPKDER